MNEVVHELSEGKSTSSEQINTQSLVSDMKKLSQAVNELARRNSVMEKILRKMAEKDNIPLSHI